jgi:very-short-patch-repair endonuclease
MARDAFMAMRARELRRNQTPAEQRLWQILRAKRLGGVKFRRQQVVGQFIADFASLAARLVIEVDGGMAHGDDASRLRDAKRSREIEHAGYGVIRFWDDDVLGDSNGGVGDVILEALLDSALPAAEKERIRNLR